MGADENGVGLSSLLFGDGGGKRGGGLSFAVNGGRGRREPTATLRLPLVEKGCLSAAALRWLMLGGLTFW